MASLLCVFLLMVSGCVDTETENDIITAKLVNVEGGEYVESAELYEGTLTFEDIYTQKEHEIFVCTEDWSWVVEGNCYILNLPEINENIEQHRFSAELSGCYVGKLTETTC